ncbi:ABC transporter ATP-binding protein [Zeaxanthinibacter enoshimensis]|uniref:ABC transporter ATP-binding protein n=1 Tax=Zeaxanthinibacter enoshimensis TaxID=392009 RepID=UPI003568226D
MIKIENLHKKFGKNKVLEGVDIHFDRGGIYAILGPNGSGKTTLIKSILGMVLPDKGSITVNGTTIPRQWTYRQQLSYLPQIANFPGNLRVSELISMIKDLRGQEANESHLVQLFELEKYLDKRLSTLSGGTKQKVNLVLAFMFDSPLLILDEPTSGLDPSSLISLKRIIRTEKEMGKTVLLSSHIMHFVEEIADEIVYLLEGKIYFKGSLDALKKLTGEGNVEHAIAAIATTQTYV